MHTSAEILQAEKFIASKAVWIRKHIEKIRKKIAAAPDAPAFSETRAERSRREKREHAENKSVALRLVTERLAHFNALYGYSYGTVRIKNTASRWGSCSRRGNLNFSYKLALISPEEADYVVVHELCHRGEFNHSKAFWNLVARAIPDYESVRKRLKNRVL